MFVAGDLVVCVSSPGIPPWLRVDEPVDTPVEGKVYELTGVWDWDGAGRWPWPFNTAPQTVGSLKGMNPGMGNAYVLIGRGRLSSGELVEEYLFRKVERKKADLSLEEIIKLGAPKVHDKEKEDA